MKSFGQMKKLIWTMLVIATGFLSACKDDDVTGESLEVNDGVTTLTWERNDGYRDLNIKTEQDWELDIDGEWMMAETIQGKGTQTVRIYCEQNDEDDNRIGSVKVRTTDGEEIKIAIEQEGILASDNNDTQVSDIRQGCGVGWGYNGYGRYANNNDIKAQIINSVQLARIIKERPEYEGELMMVDDKSVNELSATNTVGTSTEDLSKNLSVDAGLDLGLPCGFSMNITANYDSKDMSNSEKNFSMKRYKYVFKRRIADDANLMAIIKDKTIAKSEVILTSGFRTAIKKLANATGANQETQIKDFISKYGTHLITQGDIGGRMDYTMTTDKKNVSSSSDIKAGLDVGYNAMFNININGNVHLSSIAKKLDNNYTASVEVKGGDAKILAGAVNNIPGACSQNDIDKWVASINDSRCTLVDFKLSPIWNIIPDSTVANMIKTYLLEGKLLKTPEGKKYQFPVINTPSAGKFELPVINNDSTQVHTAWLAGQPVAEICKEFIPAISLQNRVTVVYPIIDNKPNYAEGLFIGDGAHRPGTISWKKESGKLTCNYTEDTQYELTQVLDSIFLSNNKPSGIRNKGAQYGNASTEPVYFHFYKDNHLEGKEKAKGDYRLVKIGMDVYMREDLSAKYAPQGSSIAHKLMNQIFFYREVSYYFTGNGFTIPTQDDYIVTMSSLTQNNTNLLKGGVIGLDLETKGYLYYITGKPSLESEESIYLQTANTSFVTIAEFESNSSNMFKSCSSTGKYAPARLRRADNFSYN